MNMGVMATINQPIDQDTAVLVVEELGHTAVADQGKRDRGRAADHRHDARAGVAAAGRHRHGSRRPRQDLAARLHPRTKVAAGEAGGITQHIGAYHVEDAEGRRSRSSIRRATPPSRRCVRAARRSRTSWCWSSRRTTASCRRRSRRSSTRVRRKCRSSSRSPRSTRATPIPRRCSNDLAKHNVLPEAWGGDTMFVNVSARTGAGIDELLDTILLQADVLELKAARDGLAAGVVVESSMEKGRGAVATVLVKRGTLKPGDQIIAGQEYGRVRAHVRRERQARDRSRSVAAGRGARPVGRAERRRRAAGGRERAQGARSRAVPPGQVPRHQARAGRGRRSWKTCCRRWAMARSRPCRSSSRRTCRAARRHCATRCRSCRPTKLRSKSFRAASAASPSPT